MRTSPLCLLLTSLCLFACAAMSDPLLRAEQSQVDVIRARGTSIVYVTADAVRHDRTALIGQTEHGEQASGGQSLPSTITRTTDFLIPTADLPDPPTRSTTIEFGGGRYRPASAAGEPLSRASRHGLITRIHAIRVG